MDELVARVNVQLRIDIKSKNNCIEVGDLSLNVGTCNLLCTKTEESIEVIGKEYLLLEYLMKNYNRIVPREQIYNKVWGFDNEAESNNLEAYLSFIRKKLRIIGSRSEYKSS